jgi:hypothetical protein
MPTLMRAMPTLMRPSPILGDACRDRFLQA